MMHRLFLQIIKPHLRIPKLLRQRTQVTDCNNYLEQQMILEDALDRLKEVGAKGQRVTDLLLPLAEELSQLLVPHAFRQSCH